MSALKSMLAELIGLFIDDGALAFSIVVVVAIAAAVAALVPAGGAAAGAILLFGAIATLAANVIRAGKR